MKDLDLKRGYESDSIDLVKDFYNPVLSEARRYDRVTAYFNSGSFLLASRGMTEFLKNKGHMRLIFDVVTSDKDKEIMEANALNEKIKEDIQDLDGPIRDNLSLLAWMLDKGRLEIKVADCKKTYHPKFGLIYDDKGGIISFNGSNNETLSGWRGNIEKFKVFKNWLKGQKGFIEDDKKDFSRYWNGKTNKFSIYSLNEAVRKKILDYKPKNNKELQKTIDRIKSRQDNDKEKFTPRYYQNEAIETWEKNDFRGIWAMATGTGKTLTALWGIKRLEKNTDDSLVVVVVVPKTPILKQWREDFEERDYKVISTRDYRWKDRFSKERGNLEMGSRKKIVLLTTYDFYYKDKFKEELKGNFKKLLIADEVHHSGATRYYDGLDEFYEYRLGLSATPERYMDKKGTNLIIKYFEGIIYEYGLEKAIAEGHLAPYKYHIDSVSLTEEEWEKYSKYTRGIAVLLNEDKISEEEREKLERLTRKRAKIIKKAENKQKALRKRLGNTEVDKAIFFCTDSEQLERMERVLDGQGVIYHRFTGEENEKERDERSENFKKGLSDALIAMKVLDEGFDLPEAKQAFLLSSTGNPAQYIQRRGRVLRMPKDTEEFIANIYDFLVIPELHKNQDLSESEKTVIKKEVDRFKEFAELAENYEEELESIFEKINVALN